MMRRGWECQESGWWTLEGHGAVCREGPNPTPWAAYGIDHTRPMSYHRTMLAALLAVERATRRTKP